MIAAIPGWEANTVEKLDDEKFIKRVEGLINPMDVSSLLYLQTLKRVLPAPILRRMLRRASQRAPHVGFVIEPYSLFLFFRLRDLQLAGSLLPERYELSPARIFADDEPEFYLGIGNLSTRASTFWGIRQESYLIARDKETGLLSWIFIDILSNTIVALPTTGITDPNSRHAIFTTSSKGEVFLDISEDGTDRGLTLTGSITGGKTRRLDEGLWVMGNTSIGHSKALSGGDDRPFAVIFDPAEVETGLDIPTGEIRITRNTLFPGLAEPELRKVACFPFAQHYIADSPGCHTPVKDRAEMLTLYRLLSASDALKTYSARTIEAQLLVGIAITLLVAIGLVIVL